MSIQVAKYELESLTKFQQDIHLTSNMSEDIISNFHRAFIKSTWYSSVPLKLKSSKDGSDTIYSVNNSFHFLLYSYMRFVLPAIRVKPNYKGRVRIAWCHNVGTNIVNHAVFRQDDDTYQEWDNVWADIYFQFYQTAGAGKRESHDIGVGNVKYLEGWNEYLPSYPINVDQPWFYSMDHALAFPIFYKGSLTRAEHRYSFKTKIFDILRVQILSKDKTWKSTINNVEKYLDVNTTTLKAPELWGRYSYITDPEIKWYKCKKSRSFYTRDVVVCDTPNPTTYNSTAQIELQCVNPCLAFFWVAENCDAIKLNNHSNYTTDAFDIYQGWDPIRTTSLIYGTTLRLDKMPSDHFSIAEPRKHFPSAPSESGFHGYSFAWDSTSYHGDIGIVFSVEMKAKLSCDIYNNNIFTSSAYDDDKKNVDEDEIADSSYDETNKIVIQDKKAETLKTMESVTEEMSPKFVTRVRLLVVRKFTITSDNEDYNFSIV